MHSNDSKASSSARDNPATPNRAQAEFRPLRNYQCGGGPCHPAGLRAKFQPVAAALVREESRIVGELNGAQGKPVDIGGYYHSDANKCAAAMRPSATFNGILAQLG